MAEKKNQHFVPQYYFRNFSIDKKSINIILKGNGKTIQNAPIKGQCSKNNFYGDIEIEDMFSKIEAQHSHILKKLIAIDSLHDFWSYYNDFDIDNDNIQINPDILVLLQLILFQKNRTEFELRRANHSFSHIAKELFTATCEKNRKEGLLKYRDKFDIKVDQTETILILIRNAFNATPAILDLGIYLIKNRTDTKYVFSDSPVVMYNKAYHDIKEIGVLGLQSPGLLIFFPISTDTCILLIDEIKYFGDLIGKNFFELTNKNDVDSLNKLQLHNSLNTVYFSDYNDKKYVNQLWRQQKNNFVNNLSSVKIKRFVHPPTYEEKEFMFVHTQQIPYSLNLSFLYPVDLSNEQVLPIYRNKELIDFVKNTRDAENN